MMHGGNDVLLACLFHKYVYIGTLGGTTCSSKLETVESLLHVSVHMSTIHQRICVYSIFAAAVLDRFRGLFVELDSETCIVHISTVHVLFMYNVQYETD